METMRTIIAARLKQARIDAGFKTAKEFAEKYHLPLSAYGHHENGTRGIKPQVAANYCQLLNIHPAWLYTGNEHNNDLLQQLPLRSLDDEFDIIKFIYKTIYVALAEQMTVQDALMDKAFAITRNIYKQLINNYQTKNDLMPAAKIAVEAAIATMVIDSK